MGKLAYKVFDKDWKCRDYDFKNEKGEVEGTIHKIEVKPKLCEVGFHYCLKLADCFNYYSFNSENKVALIEVIGSIDSEKNSDKECTNQFKIIKELNWFEVLSLCNTGNNNTGHSNTGDNNTGDWNTGYRNTGDSNAGNSNTGYNNTGDNNTGHRNAGYRNAGNSNTGYNNTGDNNTGYWNAGYRNTGDNNTGDWNTGHRNAGYFNTTTPQLINVFNKECSIKLWKEKNKPDFIYFELSEWIDFEKMTENEKENNKNAKDLGGFLKQYTYKEAFMKSYLEAKNKEDWEEQRELLVNLPNFDKEIFKEISGIDIDKD